MSAVIVTFSPVIHRPYSSPSVLTQVFGPAKSRCGKKDALVQSGLQTVNDGIDSDLDKLLP
jgi:hypothetical protein